MIWLLKDHLPDECRTSRPLFSLLARARHWHGANIVAVPLKSYQNLSETNDLLNSVRVESLVAGDIECLPEFLSKNVLWRGRKSDFFPGFFIYSFLMFVFFSQGVWPSLIPKPTFPSPWRALSSMRKRIPLWPHCSPDCPEDLTWVAPVQKPRPEPDSPSVRDSPGECELCFPDVSSLSNVPILVQ